MQLPGPLRAVVGLAANVADEARHLPDRALELPMLAVSTALQMSLRAQQRYARLAARGDEVLSGRPTGDDPPPWATFDDPLDELPDRRGTGPGASLAAGELLDDIFGAAERDVSAADQQFDAVEDDHLPAPTPISAGKKSPKTAKKSTKKAARKTVVEAADGMVGSDADDDDATGKSVSKPRHTTPSKFDDAGD